MGVIENINNFTYGKAFEFRDRAPESHLIIKDEKDGVVIQEIQSEGVVTFDVGSVTFRARSRGVGEGGELQGRIIKAGEGGTYTFGTEEVILYVEGDV